MIMAKTMEKEETEEKEKELESVTPPRGLSPFEEMERWFEESLPRPWRRRRGWPSMGELTRPMGRIAPRIDLIDRDDELLLRAEVPGVKKDDLDISVTENAVTLKGSATHEEKEERGDFYRNEIVSGAFSRTVNLPDPVDTDKVKASFADGLLQLTLPKISKTRRRRITLE
jgi:HSP20 family protein